MAAVKVISPLPFSSSPAGRFSWSKNRCRTDAPATTNLTPIVDRRPLAPIIARRSCPGVSPFVAAHDAEREGGDVMEGFEQYEACFAEISAGYPLFVEGDDLGSTFCSSGAVLLLMAVLNTGSPSLLANLTGLPVEFTAGVVRCADRKDFRLSECFNDLEQTIRRDPSDHADIRSSLECALERFWLSADSSWTGGLLCQARQGCCWVAIGNSGWMRSVWKSSCRV